MSNVNTYGAGHQENKRGGYQQKGGKQQSRGGGASGSNRDQQQQQQQQQQQYVKKGTGSSKQVPQYQLSEQEKIEQLNQMAEENIGAGGELTAAQKFDMMFSGSGGGGSFLGQQEEVKVQETTKHNQTQVSQPKNSGNPLRRRFKKDQLLTLYAKQDEIDFKCFQKDVLNWLEIFSSSAQDPEASVATDSKPSENTTLQQKSRPPMGGGKPGFQQNRWRGAPGAHYQEEEENEEDPEWVDFDPKKESSSFFGRAITNETELRENIKKERNIQQQLGRHVRGGRAHDDDEFEKLIREEKEAQKGKQIDKELEQKLDVLAKDLEKNERNYSDIDMIYEKNAKQRNQQQPQQQRRQQQALNDDELEDLFTSLMEEETKKKQTPQKQAPQQKQQPTQEQQQQQQAQPQVQLPQNLQQQIKNLSLQQKQHIQAQKLVTHTKPKFTAYQNIQNLFQNLPVVTHEKHRIKMDEIANIHETQKGELFGQLMASINPFSKFIIEETQQGLQDQENEISEDDRYWTLEESIFQKPTGEAVNPDTLKKTSSEMFVIYKYFSDPLIKVKSEKYTEDKFVQIKDLFPKNNLLQTSPLNLQLQQQMPMMNPQAKMMMGNMMMNPSQLTSLTPNAQAFIPQQKAPQQQQQQQENQPPQQQQLSAPQQDSDKQRKELQKVPQQYLNQGQDQSNLMANAGESLEDDEDDGEYEQQQQQPRVDLTNMESQLKSLLGFNPR